MLEWKFKETGEWEKESLEEEAKFSRKKKFNGGQRV